MVRRLQRRSTLGRRLPRAKREMPIASRGIVPLSYRCRACATEFLLFHTERRPRTAGSAGDELTAPGLLPAISTCQRAATT
jgi:hypothetical protein